MAAALARYDLVDDVYLVLDSVLADRADLPREAHLRMEAQPHTECVHQHIELVLDPKKRLGQDGVHSAHDDFLPSLRVTFNT
jgi:hypothetical protein